MARAWFAGYPRVAQFLLGLSVARLQA